MARDVSSQPFDESSLVERLRDRSSSALAEAYARYGPIVYQTALRTAGCPADASDVLQDVFLRLPASIQGFEGRGSLRGWLRKVALRSALIRCRARRRRAEVSLDVALSCATRDKTLAPVDRVALQRAVAALSPCQRTVFFLSEIQGYSHQEIADVLGIRRGTSEVRLFRARQLLRRQLTA